MLRLALAAIAIATVLPGIALAQDFEAFGYAPDYAQQIAKRGAERDRIIGNTREIIEADHLAKAAGIACQTIDARPIAHNKTGAAFEVACKNSLGWMVTSLRGRPEAYDCLALTASREARTDGEVNPALCHLPMNLRQEVGLQALLKEAGVPDCFATRGKHLGYGGEPKISRYEVACKNGGYIIDIPTPGSDARVQVAACDTAAEIGGACRLKR